MKLLTTFAATLVASLCVVSSASAQSKDWSSIKIATEGAYKPWNFTDPSGKLIGFEIDLAENLCKRMKAKCEIVAQAFDGVIPALNAGKFDAIMSGMNITDKRKEAIAFTQPYGRTPSTFAVLKSNPLAKLPEAGKVYSLSADGAPAAEKSLNELKLLLKGKIVAVQTSTAQASFMEKYFKDVVEIRQYKTTEQHDLDLAAGRVDAVFASMSYLKGMVESPDNKDTMLSGPRYGGGALGFGVAVGLRKNDSELQSKFDAAVGAAVTDGTVKTMSMKWFGFDITPVR
ncbi:MAG TPA: ABC transporter substrate-binding protein [Polaromonas sp.]|uniref:lysine/arginine/ornithine ABC transporter substrate-binding protein n=1 Tax=Polaromonas sp. UBA4122 TaxID=1947074 RepID=UPI000ECA0DFF|nr:lysine/arginine/ornithine ABC transporter substrate-binding protein [Polaromonas sp. UBA4122]HAL38173.1 ABC transporter substrate-binding protein [Polaromonas sp.]